MTSTLSMLVFVVLLSAPAAAQQPPGAPAEPVREAEEAEKEAANEVALVLAGTYEKAEKDTFFTIGAEYERRFSEHFGVLVELEHVNGPDSWVFAVPFVVRPNGGIKLFTGPGFEHKPFEIESETRESGGPSHVRHKNVFLWRTGAGYSWELAKRFVVGPSVAVDFIHEEHEWTHAFVFGVSVGVAF